MSKTFKAFVDPELSSVPNASTHQRRTRAQTKNAALSKPSEPREALTNKANKLDTNEVAISTPKKFAAETFSGSTLSFIALPFAVSDHKTDRVPPL